MISPPHGPLIDKKEHVASPPLGVFSWVFSIYLVMFKTPHSVVSFFFFLVLCCGAQGRSEKAAEAAAAVAAAAAATASSRSGLSSVVHQVNDG